MTLQLTDVELRVIGALIEKELATPDYYPLTLSALVNACNQKTSRDPVTNYRDDDVGEVLPSLIREGLVRERNPAGARVPKYAHRLGDSLGLSFGFSQSQRAVLAVLMLRGDQTPGELKARSERLRGPHASDDIEAVLNTLIEHDRGPWVRELAREPGRREARWRHLMSASPDAGPSSDPEEDAVPAERPQAPGLPNVTQGSRQPDRVEALEQRVRELSEAMERLAERVDRLEGGGDPGDGAG